MNRFVGWLGRRGAAASALGVSAALVGEALAESRKKGGNGGQRKNRDDRKDEDETRDQERRATDEQDDGGERANRKDRLRDDDDRDRDDRRGSASAEQDANDDAGGEDAARQATTPTPTPAAGAPPLPTPPPIGETNASIEDAQGNVIVGFDPESGSVVATSGNVSAISGPGGPTVIINDDEAVAPVPDEGVTPNPDGGNNTPDPDFAS